MRIRIRECSKTPYDVKRVTNEARGKTMKKEKPEVKYLVTLSLQVNLRMVLTVSRRKRGEEVVLQYVEADQDIRIGLKGASDGLCNIVCSKHANSASYIDKKENNLFLIYKEILMERLQSHI